MSNRLALAIVLASCGGGGGNPVKDAAIDAMPPDPRTVVATVPATLNRNLDLMFVIDDSGSMLMKQESFAASFPGFLDALSAIEGGLPDLHIGVVTTDMGTRASNNTSAPPIGTVGQGGCANAGKDGVLVTNAAPLEAGATFVSDLKQGDGTRLTNYTGTLDVVLGQMVKAGANGCGFEQPLHAMKRALQNPANAGFIRPDAKLGIVFLTDEDDCSVKSTQLFDTSSASLGPLNSFRCTALGVLCEVGGASPGDMSTPGIKEGCGPNRSSPQIDEPRTFSIFLRSVKPDERDVFVAGVVGDSSPFVIEEMLVNGNPQFSLGSVCPLPEPNSVLFSVPGVRMNHFFDLLPDRGHTETICSTDFTQQLANIGRFAALAIGNPCITHTLAMPLDCLVEDDTGTMKTTIPPCGSPETAPCWKIDIDATACPTAQNQKLVIVRSGPPTPSTVATMRCKL